MRKYRLIGVVIIGLLTLTSCVNQNSSAPISDDWSKTLSTEDVYTVKKGDTMYSIAWRFGKDYRDLASLNDIPSPYKITVGQKLQINGAAGSAAATPAPGVASASPSASSAGASNSAATTTPAANGNTSSAANSAAATTATAATATSDASTADNAAAVPNGPISKWYWPASGKVISSFASSHGNNKGLDIAGKQGQPVMATAAGKVVYAGNGLRGYGELIIIKHNDDYLSAYAHNQKILVHEGQAVQAGQTIALMGSTEADQVMLHFEIRQDGKPVDPMQYLNAKMAAQ